MSFHFEWDPEKARSNKLKHEVSFEEGQAVFYDEHAIYIADPDYDGGEERFLLLGMSLKPRVLVVCHCYRKKGASIRIISAREATRREQGQYWGHNL